jgi:hypothetical protein
MMRLGSVVVAIALGVGLSASSVVADQEAPRKLVAPVRGEAAVEITPPDTRIVGSDVVTKIRVKNVSSGPIAGFKIDENWFKGSDALSGDSYRHGRPLQVNEVIEITLTVPRTRVVGARNQYQFSHANGTIKPKTVKTLELPKSETDKAKPAPKKP